MKRILLSMLVLPSLLAGQAITWQNVTSSYSLPAGITIVRGTRTSPALTVVYADADLNNASLAVRPYAGASASVAAFNAAAGAYVSVNGGFFGSGTPYSAVVYPNEVKAVNVPTVTRNGLAYPVIRGFFGMKTDRTCRADWIYQFGSALADVYTFAQPLPYAANDPTPKATPDRSAGTPYTDLLTGIGGGPVLIKNGVINITYNQEIMWGSGVGETNSDPRTAIGFTPSKHVILIAADGRQTSSAGVSLAELAQILKDLGCTEAVNLDGGGSTQMAIGNQTVNSPSESRSVPAVFSIVHVDSLNIPKAPLYSKIIDTGDSSATVAGGGWFETANSGYWGTTRSLLHAIGTGTAYAEFRPWLPASARYSVYAWWVASSNRCANTPVIIRHADGIDTVRRDQTVNGSAWNLVGTYRFTGTAADRITITDAGTAGTYVVADAVKLESFDPAVLSAVRESPAPRGARAFELERNYPNPFNPSTAIRFTLAVRSHVALDVYDAAGRRVRELVNETKAPGTYHVMFSGDGLPSGVYFCRLVASSGMQTRSMVLIK